MRATVKDVARLAGVSPKTVSNVVNDLVPVSPNTRARVELAVAELDYVPNLAARGLRNGRTGMIALALPDLATPYSAATVQAFVTVGQAHGWSIHVEETAMDVERESALVSRAREHLVDGLVLNPVLLEASAVQRVESLPPVVLIGEVDQPAVDHVWVDNRGAIRDLVCRLVALGHRRVAVVGVVNSASSQLRLAGWRDALHAAGLPHGPDLQVGCPRWTSAGGYAALRLRLSRGWALPDALVCLTDSIALGVLNLLQERGIRVPEDVSVSGYDDIPEATYLSPSLTTVSFDKTTVAQHALGLLAARIRTPEGPALSRTVPYRVIERRSTGVASTR